MSSILTSGRKTGGRSPGSNCRMATRSDFTSLNTRPDTPGSEEPSAQWRGIGPAERSSLRWETQTSGYRTTSPGTSGPGTPRRANTRSPAAAVGRVPNPAGGSGGFLNPTCMCSPIGWQGRYRTGMRNSLRVGVAHPTWGEGRWDRQLPDAASERSPLSAGVRPRVSTDSGCRRGGATP